LPAAFTPLEDAVLLRSLFFSPNFILHDTDPFMSEFS
jgi:hypothetical protein